jgi:DNA-directed RNA polymerase subunit RPC12/RpoP
MCDIYVPTVGYVCEECKREFINQYRDFISVEEDLRLFIETTKTYEKDDCGAIAEEFFKKYTR